MSTGHWYRQRGWQRQMPSIATQQQHLDPAFSVLTYPRRKSSTARSYPRGDQARCISIVMGPVDVPHRTMDISFSSLPLLLLSAMVLFVNTAAAVVVLLLLLLSSCPGGSGIGKALGIFFCHLDHLHLGHGLRIHSAEIPCLSDSTDQVTYRITVPNPIFFLRVFVVAYTRCS